MTQLLENGEKFYCREINSFKSTSLMDDLRTIFEIHYPKQIITENDDNSNNDDIATRTRLSSECVLKSKMSLEFSPSFRTRLAELEQLTRLENEQLEKLVPETTNSILLLEMNDFTRFFRRIQTLILSLNEIIDGSRLFDERTLRFFVRINQSSTWRRNFVEFVQSKLRKSAEFRRMLSERQLEWTRIIDPSVFFDYKRCVSACLYDAYNSERKKTHKTTEIIKERCFLLQVIEDSENPTESSPGLVIKNVNVVNANYEIMSKSFHSMSRKCVHTLDSVRVRPLLDEDRHLYAPSRHGETYKYVPLLDALTFRVICVFCIKFWQSSTSSLSNTIESGNKQQQATSRDEDQNTGSNTNGVSIPFYAPIYFYIDSDEKNIDQDLCELLRD